MQSPKIKMPMVSFTKEKLYSGLIGEFLFIPVACIISRLLEEPSFATTFQGVYFIFYFLYFAAACFGPCRPSSGGIHNYFMKLLHPQWIRCFVLLGFIYFINFE
jgi:hypothetical protein